VRLLTKNILFLKVVNEGKIVVRLLIKIILWK